MSPNGYELAEPFERDLIKLNLSKLLLSAIPEGPFHDNIAAHVDDMLDNALCEGDTFNTFKDSPIFKCPACGGVGQVEVERVSGSDHGTRWMDCKVCNGGNW